MNVEKAKIREKVAAGSEFRMELAKKITTRVWLAFNVTTCRVWMRVPDWLPAGWTADIQLLINHQSQPRDS
jgi:hypothetical protein